MSNRKDQLPTSPFTESLTYECGPYLGYWGKARWSAADDKFIGRILNVYGTWGFAARRHQDLAADFIRQVNKYLEYQEHLPCKPENKSSNAPGP